MPQKPSRPSTPSYHESIFQQLSSFEKLPSLSDGVPSLQQQGMDSPPPNFWAPHSPSIIMLSDTISSEYPNINVDNTYYGTPEAPFMDQHPQPMDIEPEIQLVDGMISSILDNVLGILMELKNEGPVTEARLIDELTGVAARSAMDLFILDSWLANSDASNTEADSMSVNYSISTGSTETIGTATSAFPPGIGIQCPPHLRKKKKTRTRFSTSTGSN